MMAGHRIQLPAFKLMIRQHSIIITVGRRRQRRFLIGVRRLHMLPHMRRRHKRFGAEGAMVGLLAGVRVQMKLQVDGLGKGFGAQLTLVRLLARVDSHVYPQHRGSCKCLGAQRTAEGSLAGVHERVLEHAGRGGEGLRSECTSVRLLAGVHSLMLLQVAQLHKRSGAQRTYERLLIRVDQNVSVKRRRLRE